jgi:3-hydroxyacyl-[acyl-carrier-protein] dehydratase
VDVKKREPLIPVGMELDVERLLPHRYPFLLLDRIVSYERGRVSAIKCISFDAPYLQGHFPGIPIVPGVLLIEMMAQAGAVIGRLDSTVQSGDGAPQPGLLAAVEHVRFLAPAKPGDRLLIEASIQTRIGPLVRLESAVSCDDNELAKGRIVLHSAKPFNEATEPVPKISPQ